MTFVDIENLFEYLAIHFENNPKVHNKRLKNAWFEILEPYAPADVKTALLQCLREKRFFPDAQAVASKCTQAVPASANETTPKKWLWPGWPAYAYRDVDDYREQMQSFIRRSREEDRK